MSSLRGRRAVDGPQRSTDTYGDWNAVYKRFARWCELGIWEQMHAYFANDPDMESLMIDSTVVRAHPCAAGASKKTVGKPRRRSDAVEVGSAPKSM